MLFVLTAVPMQGRSFELNTDHSRSGVEIRSLHLHISVPPMAAEIVSHLSSVVLKRSLFER